MKYKGVDLSLVKNKSDNEDCKSKLKAYILGGLNEVGKNCLAIECNNDIIVVDAGMAFPDDEMLGVDFVIPDTTFLEENKNKIKALIITHAHLDHIGALQHILPKIGFPLMIMTRLTAGLVKKRLEEYRIIKQSKIKIVDPEKDKINAGCFDLEFFPVNHSVPDCMGVFGKTPAGKFVHTGDFKIDFTPVDGKSADVGRMAEIGKQGVDVIFCESTNATKEGFCKSEKIIDKNLRDVIADAKGRIILSSFSSLITRIEKIVIHAHEFGRKVFVSGRSMQNYLEIANKLGFFKVPKGVLMKLDKKIEDLKDEQILIITTGSQGEPRSALTRIGLGTHPNISIKKGDTVVFSSSPIPGNERGVATSINNIIKLGADVVTNDTLDIHVSGHGHSGDIKMMHSLIKAKTVVPIHGELFMRQAQRNILLDLDYKDENICILENGSVAEYCNGKLQRLKEKIPAELIMVDGLGSGDIGTRVMEERKVMSNSGLISVIIKTSKDDFSIKDNISVESLGFIYMKESKTILKEINSEARKSYENYLKKSEKFLAKKARAKVVQSIKNLTYKKIKREPMVIVSIVII